MKLGIEYECIPTYPADLGPDDLCLAFGKDNLKKLQDKGLCPKNRAITSMRGKLIKNEAGGQFMVTWDPALAFTDYKYRPDILWDLKLARRIVTTGSPAPKPGTYEEVQDLAGACHRINAAIEKHGRANVSVDLETLGTDYMNPDAYIVALSVTTDTGRAHVMHFSAVEKDDGLPPIVKEQLEWILSGGQGRIFVYGANFKYDGLWMMAKWGIHDFSNFRFDTTLVGSLVQENRSNSLNLHAKIYTPIGGYDDGFNALYDKARMDLVPKEDVIQYAGGDTDAVHRVSTKLKAELAKDKRLHRFYTRLVHPAQNAVRKMEFRGMCVDQERYKQLDEELTAVIEQADETMLDMLSYKLRAKYIKDLKPHRPVIVRDFLFSKQGLNLTPKILTPAKGEPSTSAEHFQMFANHPKAGPFVKAFIERAHAGKTKSTYIDGFLKYLRSDGRFHPSYMLFRGLFHGDSTASDDSGGRTGRTSVKEPAYQTIPKHTDWAKPLRSVFIPPVGYVILDIDFSQGELRICADIAGEPTMIANYAKGEDLHLRTGALLNNISFEEALALKMANDPIIKAIRQGGKAGNFGLIYGMGAEGFVEYARTSYGVILTLAQAQAFIDAFFGEFTRLRPWHAETIELAHKQHFIRSPLGRVRHLPLIDTWMQDIRAKQERQAINTGVQSTLTDMGLLAMAELDKAYPDLWLFGFTHDSLSFYVPEDDYIEWAKKIKAVMENLPLGQFGWKPKLDFPVEVEYGLNNLAETVELPLAA